MSAFFGCGGGVIVRPEDRPALEPWVLYWQLWVGVSFLQGYLGEAGRAPFLPEDREDFELLLNTFLREKAVAELGYELQHRPDWVLIPLWGLRRMLEAVGR